MVEFMTLVLLFLLLVVSLLLLVIAVKDVMEKDNQRGEKKVKNSVTRNEMSDVKQSELSDEERRLIDFLEGDGRY